MQIAGELRKIVMTDHTGTERGVDMTPEETKAAEAQAAETKSETRGADSPQAKCRGRSKDSLGAAGTLTSEKADAATAETEASEDIREGELVWYNERKGYGFVRIGEEEVFLHRSTLDRFGLVRLLTGDIVNVSLSTNEHGQVIKDLLSVRQPLSPAPPAAHEPAKGEVRAVVKFFNDLRGYGFVTADDLEEDVFVHSRVLNDCGFSSLIQGQKLLVKVDDSGRGLQVNSVRLLAD